MIQILLAVFNGEKFIEAQITSIMNQSHSDIHLVIRDNCSYDQTVLIVEKLAAQFSGKITLIKSITNDGVIGNFAKLAEYSSAPYVMFSDADDVWHKDKVLKSYQKIQEMEKQYGTHCPLLVHTDLTVVDRNLSVIHPSFWHYSNINPLKGVSLPRQLVQNTITGCTTIMNRALLVKALPFPDCIVMHDWWLGLIAAAVGKIEIVSEPTISYRQHGNNDTGAKRYSLLSFLKRLTYRKEKDKIRANIEKKFAQAACLKERLESQLTSSQVQILDNFIRLESSGFFYKRFLTISNGFYKQGYMRNFLELLPYEYIIKS